MSRIYLAARYSRHPEMRQYRAQLEALGHQVTAEWIDDQHNTLFPDDQRAWAIDDWNCLLAAEWSIHFTEGDRDVQGCARGGRHVEYGIALMLHDENKHRIIIVGSRENIFHHLPEIEQYDTWDECFAMLTKEA